MSDRNFDPGTVLRADREPSAGEDGVVTAELFATSRFLVDLREGIEAAADGSA